MAAALLTACSDAAGTAVASPVSGVWQYRGTQNAPLAQLDGSLSWRGVSSPAGAFEGTFSISEIVGGVQQRTLVGTSAGQLVTGQGATDTIANFDLNVSGLDRQHLGVLRGDSISGTWTEIGGNAASGRFVLYRNSGAIR